MNFKIHDANLSINLIYVYLDISGSSVVHYEDMKKDLKKEVQRIATFVGKNLMDEVVEAIVEACTFKGMKTNPMTNCDDVPVFKKEISAFFRKGEVRDYLSKEQNEYLDRLTGPSG